MVTIRPMQCALGAVAVHVVRVSDTFGRVWVAHEYPGRDDVEHEDLGRRPARFEVEAVFVGAWKGQVLALRRLVEEGGETTFTHPYWGTGSGVATDLRILHEDRQTDTAVVSFVFTEGTQVELAFAAATTLASAAGAASNASTSTAAAAATLPE